MRNRHPLSAREAAIAFGINNRLIELTDEERLSDQIIVNKLITTLIYESNRHGWNAPHCIAMRQHIINLQPAFNNLSRSSYEQYIANQETANNTFYGSYLSDDSDSEEEQTFQRKPAAQKRHVLAKAAVDQQRGQLDKISYKRGSGTNKKGDLKVTSKGGSEMFDLDARMTIHHSPDIDINKVKRDLDHLNILLKKGYSLSKALEELKQQAEAGNNTFTKFYLAEYRGVTYLTTKWNKPSRKAHRDDTHEIGERQYCASVYKAAGVSLFRNYDTAKLTREQHPELFNNPAEELREILLTFREPKPYSYSSYSYSNLGYLLQNIYTQDYDGFHKLISENDTLKSLLLNDANPFFSMGDTPYHALKYAYGLKPYAGHENERLRPRWRQDGRAERPYSGVVYTSLHQITDYDADGPLHLITLNRQAEIKLQSELNIIAERESCFPSYLPEDRIIHKHIAKYPSFKAGYKTINAYKYGLPQSEAEKFRTGLTTNAPHTPTNRKYKQLLGEYLCSYQEAKLIDNARTAAENKGGVLIYRDCDGTFSLTPPVDSVNRNSNKITAEIKTPVKQKQNKRASFATNQVTIQPLTDEESVFNIVDDHGYDSDSESASINTEGNHTISLPLSLMLNAIKNRRYRALKKFLTIPIFQEAVNERFNSDNLEDGTLLHLAAARNDIKAIKLLTDLPHCDLNATANESCENAQDKFDFYEDITPAQLAIMRNCNDAALMLIKHPRNDNTQLCAYVTNKDLLSGDMLPTASEIDEESPTNDEDFLGYAWRWKEAWPITRTRECTSLHLATKFGNVTALKCLLDQKQIDIDKHNTALESALSVALDENDAQSVSLLIETGAKLSEWRKHDIEYLLVKSNPLNSTMR